MTIEQPQDPVSSRVAWIVVIILTITCSILTTREALRRYETLQTGWSWDLAYYNQWYWALTRGDQILSVRPIAAYADEGPSVWKTNYVSPLRYALIPIHYAFPDPRTLLVVHAWLFWLVIPASFTLLRSKTTSNALALFGTSLVPLTPLLWPLAFNDFREIQIAIPFVLWGVQGVTTRSVKVAALGVAGMLACRQELAVVVGSLALLKSDHPEDISDTFRWRHSCLMIGFAWILLVFFGHLRFWAGSEAPMGYLHQFGGEGPPLIPTLLTGSEILALGLGTWILFFALQPRETLLIAPWIWSLAHGKWAIRFLETEDWHHVRYVTPVVALGLAAGLIGFVRYFDPLRSVDRGWRRIVGLGFVLAVVSTVGTLELQGRMRRQPRPIDAAEVSKIWEAIRAIEPADGVLAAYEVTAPLSSRKNLISYILPINQPRGYPELPKDVRWIFFRNSDGGTEVFQSQGFKVVNRGRFLTILSRP